MSANISYFHARPDRTVRKKSNYYMQFPGRLLAPLEPINVHVPFPSSLQESNCSIFKYNLVSLLNIYLQYYYSNPSIISLIS